MRIPTTRLIFCLAASGLAASCAGSSGPEVPTVDKSFLRGISSYDLNHDGVVTCDEWRTAAAGMFAAANKSGTGFLTQDEFRALATTDRTFLVADFKYYDVNGDGKIDKKEFVERPNPAFTYADKDKDCRLTETEQLTARNLSAPPAEQISHNSTVPGGTPTEPTPGGGRY
jgi:hypothetical protein